MTAVTIRPYEQFHENEIKSLYESVGWTSYLRYPDLLQKAYTHSLKTLAAYKDEQLIGIIRVVGDGVSILYIQDLLVHPAYHHKGIGTQLMKEMLLLYPDVNQVVLLTDDTAEMTHFYESAGFQKVQNVGCCSLIRLHKCYG